MDSYTIQFWLMIFFIYCFLGWVWESCYVSLKQRKWVNRGFLGGPFLPIYGSGALIVLLTTLPIKENIVLLYIVGLVSATILEYIVGYFCEKVFEVRYWDYTPLKYNIKGYICLTSSIAWGFFSIILVDIINVPIQNFILSLPEMLVTIVALVILVIFTVDATHSVQNALNLKKLLRTMATNNETIRAIVCDVENIATRIEKDRIEIRTSIKGLKSLAEKPSQISKEFHERLADAIDEVVDNVKEAEENIEENFKSNVKSMKERNKAEIDVLTQISEYRVKVQNRRKTLIKDDLGNYKGALKLLRRNPNAYSENMKAEIEEMKKEL